ncbi:MAG: molybdopterin-dependent oxidoreductase [Thermodesulfobacteriota bacterium]
MDKGITALCGECGGHILLSSDEKKRGLNLLAVRRTVDDMETRREFIELAIRSLAGLSLLVSLSFSGVRRVWAKTKKVILPRGTKRESLVNKNPADLDASNLEVTPLKDFGTMGLTDHEVNLDTWRLEVTGHLKKPLRMGYSEITGLPSIERTVLLICPGFFANHGTWKGISIKELLQRAETKVGVTHVTIRGPKGPYEKVMRYPIKDVLSDKVFLAYRVNGEDLPRKHGFPLRAVAEDYYGHDWVKFVYEVRAEKIERGTKTNKKQHNIRVGPTALS